MSDPNTPETTEPQDTTTTEPTPGGTPAEVNEYQQRYENLRPQYDRTMQELQSLRQQHEALRNDPDAQRAFLAELGYQVEDDPADAALYDDPVSALRAELDEIKQTQAQRDQQAQMEQQMRAGEAHISNAIQAIDSSRPAPLDDEEQAWVISRALASPPGENGMPDIQGAYQAFQSFEEGRMRKWAASKQTPHRVSQAGGEVTEDNRLDVDDPGERQRRMAQRLADLNAG